MPRFYLHICNGNGFTEDEEGVELPDVHVARLRAIESLRDIMASEMLKGEVNMASFIEIEDESHTLVDTVQFLDAVEVRTERSNRRDK